MSRVIIIVIGLFSLCAFSPSANAQGLHAIPCEGCSLQEMRRAASAEIDFGGIIVFSLSTGDIENVIITPTGRIHQGRITDEMAAYFTELVWLYRNNGNSLKFSYSLPSSANAIKRSGASAAGKELPMSAYEALSNSSRMNNLLDHMHNRYPSIIAGANSVFRVFNPVTWLNSNAASVRVEVRFPDGTRLEVVYSYKKNKWERVPNSAKDAHNNSIPETREEFAERGYQEYEFRAPPDTDLINFVNWATVHGITMTGSIVERVIACTNVEGNIHCRSIRKW